MASTSSRKCSGKCFTGSEKVELTIVSFSGHSGVLGDGTLYGVLLGLEKTYWNMRLLRALARSDKVDKVLSIHD